MAKKQDNELKDMSWDEIEKKGLMDKLWKSGFWQEKFLESMEKTSKALEAGKSVYIYGDDGKVIYRVN